MCVNRGKYRQGGDGHTLYHKDVPDEKLVPLDAHHITDRNDMPNGGYVKENSISLCDDDCHLLAEVYHQTGIPHPGYSPTDLYTKIGVSFDEAYRASLLDLLTCWEMLAKGLGCCYNTGAPADLPH